MLVRKIGKRLGRSAARYSLFLCSLIIKLLPRQGLFSFADAIAFLGYSLARKQRKIAVESLGIAFDGQLGAGETLRIAKDSFRNMARGAVELLYILQRPQLTKELAVIEGKHYLDQALSKGRGVIVVSAHFGNFPLAITRLKQEGYKVSIILRRMRDERIEDFLESRRRKLGINSIYSMPRQLCVEDSLKALRNNTILFLQLDQNFGSGGVFVDFFNKKAATATGPVVLGLRTGSPLIPLFIVRRPDNTYKIIIEPEFVIENKESREETLRYNIQRITSLIESYIRRYPAQWGWIHRRWKSRPLDENK